MYFYIMDGKYLSRALAAYSALITSPIDHCWIYALTPYYPTLLKLSVVCGIRRIHAFFP